MVFCVQSTALSDDSASIEARVSGVRKLDRCSSPAIGYEGAVILKTEGSLILRSYCKYLKSTVDRTFYPVDLLAQQKRVSGANGCRAYLWSDVEKGDLIEVDTMHDEVENLTFIFAICIQRRPGKPLPKGQDHKNDHRYAKESIYNEIESGHDVDEVMIGKTFVAEKYVNRITGREIILDPGGLPEKYRERLRASRDRIDAESAKRGSDLIAKPLAPKK